MKYQQLILGACAAFCVHAAQATVTYDFGTLTGTETTAKIKHTPGSFNDTLAFTLGLGQTGVTGDFELFDNNPYTMSLVNVTLGTSTSVTLDPSHSFALTGLAAGSYQLRVAGNVTSTTPGDGKATYYTLSIMAVPEPETYAMFLAGLGLVGFIGRRKRAN